MSTLTASSPLSCSGQQHGGLRVGAVGGGEERQSEHVVPVQMAEQDRADEGRAVEHARDLAQAGAGVEHERGRVAAVGV